MQQPQTTDGILGGHTPPPVNSAILGGLDGLRQQMTVAPPDQRSQLLPLALTYGEAGVEWLITTLISDPALTVRATAYQQLQQVGLERAQQAIANGIPLKRGDRLYQVCISAVDYNDEYYTLLDSVEAFEAHDFCYDGEQFHLVERYMVREQAEQVAADLHRVILSNDSFAQFNRRHHLKLNPSDYYLTNITEDLSNFYRNASQPVHDWCVAHGIDIDLSDYLNEEILDENEGDNDGENYYWEVQEVVVQALQDQRNYPLLEELCELIGIGKFAFVREDVVDKDGFFTRIQAT